MARRQIHLADALCGRELDEGEEPIHTVTEHRLPPY
jgi:hypothetical protein